MLQSFSAVIDERVSVLVLGTMPGGESQRMQQYYAHPRNAFWPLMQRLFGIDTNLLYEQRLQALLQVRVGLWDVFAECERQGSLDSAIRHTTAQHNDLPDLLSRYPAVHTLCFNGKLAWQIFQRHYRSLLPEGRVQVLALPSTSPANASLNFEQKYQAWQCVKEAVNEQATSS